MNTKWKKTITAVLISVLLTSAPSAVTVFAQQATALEGQSGLVKLTDHVQTELVGAFSEQTQDGATIGAVIHLNNDSSKVTRVPDYELRGVTVDGVTYVLVPSADNPRSIQPKGKVELAYLLNVSRSNRLELMKLLWVNVDDYVYPRKETTLLSMNVTDKVWHSNEKMMNNDSIKLISWGQSFKLDLYSSDVTYTPFALQEQVVGQDNVTVISLKATNTGKAKAFIPDFAISGSDGSKLYAGIHVENAATSLSAGESKNIRFAIPAATTVDLNELVVTTTEHFVATTNNGGAGNVHLIGHMRISMPDSEFSLAGLKDYSYGTPIIFGSLNELVDKDVEVSLVELHMHDNQGEGYKTAIAKFKLRNNGKQPVSLPAFQAKLANSDGFTYNGDRQNVTAQQLMPGLSHVVSYAFNVPLSEDNDHYALQLLSGGTVEAPYSLPIAAIAVTLQHEADLSKVWNLYPFNVTMKHWTLGGEIDAVPFTSYSYKLILDLDIERVGDVVVDPGFSKLKIEIVDGFDKMLGSETLSFVGAGRLISGKQTIHFNNIRTEQNEYPLTIHIYEVIDTPSGEASRLIETLKQ